MAKCSDTQPGQIYGCEKCGYKIQVIEKGNREGGCSDDHDCCGQPMWLLEAGKVKKPEG